MLIEALYQALNLNIGWFIELALDNLLWVFIFFATANILDDSKTLVGSIMLFLFFVFDFFAELGFSQASGWVFLGAGFLAIVYLSRIAISIWVEYTPSLKRHMLKILAAHWLAVYIIYNLFLV